MSGQKNAKMYFAGAVILAIVATAVAFTLFFLSGNDGI